MSANCSLSRQCAWRNTTHLVAYKQHNYWNTIILQADEGITCGKRKLWDKEIQGYPTDYISHKTPNTHSTLTSHPAKSECCDKLVAGLGTLAHKLKKVFFYQHLPQRTTPKLKPSRRHHLPSQRSWQTRRASHPLQLPQSDLGAMWREKRESACAEKRNPRCPARPDRKLCPYLGNITLCHRAGETFPTWDSWGEIKEEQSALQHKERSRR